MDNRRQWSELRPRLHAICLSAMTELTSSAHEVTDYCVRPVMNNTVTGKRNNKSKRRD